MYAYNIIWIDLPATVMDIQTLLIGEIQRQSNFALIAIDELKKILENDGSWNNQKSDHFWYSVQSFLVAVANISKIFWPAPPCGSELAVEIVIQREKLRKYFDINDSSPLRSRKFRNFFEHYDFELEGLFKNLKDRMVFDSNIINFDPSGLPLDKILPIRNFNPVVFKLYFRNREYDIMATIKAINELLEKIQ